ncbi:dihydroneopterin aldolase [Paludibacter sp.]|uniref:dihydroneopterin aldolase n=1 Tax=Paludibacter sp. TaxID=1898105 RepID=UPI001353AD68|nr:dihydroneopterin aldolase [Paludibacter sp.]MTK51989.1 dihydroneopterin aldolase [Paludibacter sp.]
MKTSYILLEEMRFFAHHGVFEEERQTGNYFTVDLKMKVSLASAAESDNLIDTLNYGIAYEIVKKEMAVPSKLLEHVAKRIIDALFDEFGRQLSSVEIKLSKLNPPLGGQVAKASVILVQER